ncbi:PadR family transcriptional regulator [Chengkuizengella axinellae]|uniref:PadR family transcriptional regulator n=1 Tax=Chengkuizengella axinellae TaxID=3064388 RepID=A0ABT9IZY3_9BACL|nr:PadR family transcriptional regulator [Chengkuizengella sp. 2205SS18-9]MDP5274878.1 PadR family transcriptional regulator [Chengkuizengella sp. 2205SS18-9]
MDKKLKNLRQSMKQTVFKEMSFSEKKKSAVKREIKQENVFLSILQLLIEEKTGVELLERLKARNIMKFDESEGFLYTTLHQLVQKGYLTYRWDEHTLKFYKLNNKGRKCLKKLESNQKSKTAVLKEILGGHLS